jgi:AcrR family transcriptional regulator
MDVKGRRDEYAEITRAAIVESAIGLFASNGYAKTSIDAVAEAARVTKGGVYHHFKDKAELFEAAFVAMEQRLLAKVSEAATGVDDPWQLMAAGIGTFLDECGNADFRRIALQEAPAALGWDRWKQIEEQYFLGMVVAGLDGLVGAGLIEVPSTEMTARVFLAAAGEAGLSVAAASDPQTRRQQAATLLMRLLRGLA